ncbi:MAG: leucine-rich repeat domain-containing protein [Clostridia bacterium]|nr:leucine-rich repeat domain-containing protein [Clostridia bacterium]
MLKKYSKLIAFAAILVIAILITVLVVYFNSIEKGTNFTLGDYTVVSQGAGIAIVSYDGEETSLVIPAKIEGKKVVAVKEGAFNNSKVTSLAFEDGANIELEESAFNNNTVIETVSLPSTATSVPKNCFMNCTNLNSVTMPNSITYIGEYAFYGCSNLTKNYDKDEAGYRWFNLPTSLTEICNSAFYNCTNIDAVRVSTKLTTLGASAFRSTGIQLFQLYDSEGEDEEFLAIETIGDYAFYGTYIQSISTNKLELPQLTSIGKYAFASTSNNFKYFEIPSTVETIGDYAFSGSSSLVDITFASDEAGDKELSVGKYLFNSCTNLEKVTFTRSIDEIPEGMFMGCIKLLYRYDLVLPEEVASIGPAAFAFFSTSSTATKYCNYTVCFNHEDADGNVTQTYYNNFFRVCQLQKYSQTEGATASLRHFVITDYDITELYAYVGLFATTDSTSNYWKMDGEDAETFKFLLTSELVTDTTRTEPAKNFSTLTLIHNSAFAGAQFTKLCLPGAACNFEKNSFYQSAINTIYIEATCLTKSSTIDAEAFSNMKTATDEVLVLVKGDRGQAGNFEGSQFKEQVIAILPEENCYFADGSWPK